MRMASAILMIAMLAIAFGNLVAGPAAGPSAPESVIRDHLAGSFGYMPVHLEEDVVVSRVRTQWDNQLIVELENGRSYTVTVELRSY